MTCIETACLIAEYLKFYFRYRAQNANEAQGCTICLVDFEEGDEIRLLPCLHAYHRRVLSINENLQNERKVELHQLGDAASWARCLQHFYFRIIRLAAGPAPTSGSRTTGPVLSARPTYRRAPPLSLTKHPSPRALTGSLCLHASQ